MYKYLCVVSDSADENAFNEAVTKIKELYPDCIEAGSGSPEDEQRTFEIPDGNGGLIRVCVKTDFSEKGSGQIVIMSEAYLDGLFSDIYFGSPLLKRSIKRTDKKKKFSINYWRLLASVVFLAVNVIFSWLGLLKGYMILICFLTAVHVASAILVKDKFGISVFRILFMQLGGFFSLAVPVLSYIFLEDRDKLYGWAYFIVMIPVLAISGIMTGVISLMQKADKKKK